MALFSVYVDDSGTHRQSPVAIAGCFLSDRRRWHKFDERWEKARREPGDEFGVFHMADFEARQGEFNGWANDKAERVMNRLMDIIEECPLAAFVTAVVKEDYDRAITGRVRDKLGKYHYTFAVEACLALIEEWMVRNLLNISDGLQYVFDRMSQGKHEVDYLMDDLIKYGQAPHFGLETGGWSFQNKAVFLPLQAADILAWNGYRYMLDCQLPSLRGNAEGKVHPSFLRLVNQTPRVVDLVTKYYDKQSLPEIATEVTAHYEKVGWDGSPRGGFFKS